MLINVVQVFTNKGGEFGNPVGIVIDEDHAISEAERQRIATKLNFSETVFIDFLGETPEVSIFNPQQKVKFAGHAILGTAFFIKNSLGKDPGLIKCGSEQVKVKFNDGVMYVSAPLTIMPAWNFKQKESPKLIEELTNAEISQLEHTFTWAWEDKSKGLVRARTFAPDWGIPEDQANGSGSMKLAAQLNRSLIITHGQGSIIYANPSLPGYAQVGGLVKIDSQINL